MKLVLAAVLALALVAQAHAHPFMLETDPERLSSAREGTSVITVQYSEEVEIEFSELKVFDGSGNRIDNGDTGYHGGEKALRVSVPPLGEGVYTVSSKVLSKVDGHLVPDAFVFGVGGAVVEQQAAASEAAYYPEAAAAFPGLVGQSAVIGALAASLLVWGWRGKGPASRAADPSGGLASVAGAGAVAVLASNVLVLAVHAWRLEASPLEALGTSFGQTWMLRMGLTGAVLACWFAAKNRMHSARARLPMLATALALAATSTMTGHGAATGLFEAAALDYIHNIVAALWIGGIIFLCFGVLPSSAADARRDRLALAVIPRFSVLATACIGVVVITGPLLMWTLDDDPSAIASSAYGYLIASKIALAGAMACIGGYHQFYAARRPNVHARMRGALKAESVLGVALLGAVALLTNSALPGGGAGQAAAAEYGLDTAAFAQSVRFDLEVFPFAPGPNAVAVVASAADGQQLPDLDGVSVKVSNPAKNIPPIRTELAREGGAYAGEVTFGFTGTWLVEIEARRSQAPNEQVALDLLVKPSIRDTRTDVNEYDMPEGSKPLHPIYHGGYVWVSDSGMPAVWRFDGAAMQKYPIGGQASQMLAGAPDGKVWYTDGAGGSIGYVDPATGYTEDIPLPGVVPLRIKSVPGGIAAGADGVWITIVAKGALLKYSPETGEFSEYRLEDGRSGPFAVMLRGDKVWFTESGTGRLGVLDPKTGGVRYASTGPLASPEALLDDGEGNVWITEHSGPGLVKYNILLDSAERIPVGNPDALPFGMARDARGNIWYAEHVVDYIGVHDPHGGGSDEIPIPTQSSFVQFLASDGDGNVWFAEQNGGKVGYVAVADGAPVRAEKEPASYRYSELAGPLMAAGIAASAVFLARSVRESRAAPEP